MVIKSSGINLYNWKNHYISGAQTIDNILMLDTLGRAFYHLLMTVKRGNSKTNGKLTKGWQSAIHVTETMEEVC